VDDEAALSHRVRLEPKKIPRCTVQWHTFGKSCCMKVFIIDDDREDLEIMAEAIYAVKPTIKAELCADPEQALTMLQESTVAPDVILLDNIMPKLTGIDVIQKIKTLPNLKAARIIVLSNHISPRDQAIMDKLGIPVLQKGFNFKAIVRSIGSLLFPESNLSGI
jgi:CheY-like chemotaxis protein